MLNRSFDPEVIDGFITEANSYLPVILEGIEKYLGNRQYVERLEEAYRHTHTIKGAAAMLGFFSLGEVAGQLEELLLELGEGQLTVRKESALALRQVAIQLANQIDDITVSHRAQTNALPGNNSPGNNLPAGQFDVASGHEVSQSAGQPRPATSDSDEDDDQFEVAENSFVNSEHAAELAEVFALEAEDHLRNLNQSLQGLREQCDNRDLIQEIRRSAHSLKGAAAMVGFRNISQLAHRMEDLLDLLYEDQQPVTEDMHQLLTASTEALEDMASGRTDVGKVRALYRRFGRFLQTGSTSSSPAVQSQPAAAQSSPAPVPPVVTSSAPATESPLRPQVVPAGKPVVNTNSENSPAEPAQKPAQFLRVSLDNLDDLTRLMSELVITRAAFEEQMRGFASQIEELRSSSERLHRVSSRIETQYEGTMLTDKTAAEGTPDSIGSLEAAVNALARQQTWGFDALEFDRYTEFHLLSRELSETSSDTQTVGQELRTLVGEFEGLLNQQGQLYRQVQDKLMRMRMVPLGVLSTRLNRAVRHVAAQQGRQVDLAILGSETELDKTVMDELADPLLHLLRNAVDHGIEPPAERVAAGKPEKGTICMEAFHDGNQIVIQLSDDGRGIETQHLVETAIREGFLTREETAGMTDDEMRSLILLPGFTTSREINEVSGRGLGMDIVRSTINKLKGTMTLESTPGQGTTFTIRLPLSMATMRAVLVRVENQTYAIPQAGVEQVLRLNDQELLQNGQSLALNVNGQAWTLVWLSDLLGLRKDRNESSQKSPVLLINLAGKQLALAVDHVTGGREIAVKNFGSHIRQVHGMIGTTLLGDGSVALILNLPDLVPGTINRTMKERERSVRHVQGYVPQHLPTPGDGAASTSLGTRAEVAGAQDEPQMLAERAAGLSLPEASSDSVTVMVVDDSPSVRRVTTKLLKSEGWETVQARDGLEALEYLQQAAAAPDLLLLDIEMPRMDGYQLLSTLRNEARWQHLPVIMVTSRASAKHRQKAIELGANEYVVKPYQEEALLALIRSLTSPAQVGTAHG